MFLWRTDKNYPSIIIKYPPYLFFWNNDLSIKHSTQLITVLYLNNFLHAAPIIIMRLHHKHETYFWRRTHAVFTSLSLFCGGEMSQRMRFWYLSHRRPAKAQASLRIRAVSPEPLLFAHMKYGSRRRVWPKIRHLAPLDGCTCGFEK